MSDPSEPARLSRFEANLLRILQFLLRYGAETAAFGLLNQQHTTPRCLSRRAVELIESTLARGCISILAHSSGWWKERHIRGEDVVRGRLWQRHKVETIRLAFSEFPLRLLIWLTATKVPEAKPSDWPRPEADLTVADNLFLYFAFGQMRSNRSIKDIPALPVFHENGLCRLAYSESFDEAPPAAARFFENWVREPGSCYLEALQSELRERWTREEEGKAKIHGWQKMQALGRSQESTLNAFCEMLETHNRRDLARFLFPTLERLLPPNARPQWWIGGLTSAGQRLSDRNETYRAALTVPRISDRLRQWQHWASTAGYFDDDYKTAQLYLSDWERWRGMVLQERAQALMESLEPMRAAAGNNNQANNE